MFTIWFFYSTLFFNFGSSVIPPFYQEKSLQGRYEILHKINVGYTKNYNYNGIITYRHGKMLRPIDKLKNAIDSQREDLKCGIKLIALSIARVSELQMKGKTLRKKSYHKKINEAVHSNAQLFSSISHNLLKMLYNIGYTDLYDMWLFYSFIHIDLLNDSVNSLWKIIEINKMIIRVLGHSTQMCKGTSIFNITKSENQFNDIYQTLSDDSSPDYNKVDELKVQLSNSIDNFLKTYYNEPIVTNNSKIINVTCLYFNGFIEILGFFQYHYIFNINWGNAISQLNDTYYDSLSIKIFEDGFDSIRKYQSIFKSQMKIIMLRFIYTHIVLVNNVIEKNKVKFLGENDIVLKKYLTQEMNEMKQILKTFVKVLGLHDDIFFKFLIKFLDCDINTFYRDNNNVLDKLNKQQEKLLSSFQIPTVKDSGSKNAINTISIDHDLITKTYSHLLTSLFMGKIDKPPHLMKYIYENIRCANTFSKHLEYVLENIDFEMMDSLFSSAANSDDNCKIMTNNSITKCFSENIFKPLSVFTKVINLLTNIVK